MKVIDAYWEKRNLGVKTIEIEFENSEVISDFILKLEKIKDAQYIVLKVPTGEFELYNELNKNGFYYIESSIQISLSIKDYLLPKKIQKINNLISYHLVDSSRIDSLCNEIRKGVFSTDRIALDNNFGKDISNKRYCNWINDEYRNNNNNIFEIRFGEKEIGFFGIKEKSNLTYEIFLGGIYLEMQNFGLGFSIITKSIEEIITRNGKQLITHVSSNNIPIIRLYTQLGFSPVEIKNVFIKHL
jgi:hypothetical protein